MTPYVMLTVVMSGLTARTRPSLRLPGFLRVGSNALRTVALAAVLAVFLMAGPALCYVWLGEPEAAPVEPTPKARVTPHLAARAAQAAPSAAVSDAGADTEAPLLATPADAMEDTVSTMLEALAQRLAARPADADGWRTLGHAYAALGRHTQALGAIEAALRLHPHDAGLLVDFAYSTAVTDASGHGAEASALVTRALALSPDMPRALALAGTLALDRGDYRGAARYWERLAAVEPLDSPTARELQASIGQARQLENKPLASRPGGRTLSTADMIEAARLHVGELPLRFTLNDSLTTPASSTKRSNELPVVVGLR